jgi:catechol 2,3-dioxygenase-like lactoylglutathione lyase family enzyme
MANFIQVTPFMHAANLAEAVRFFTEILGFDLRFQAGSYAYVHRERVEFRLLEQRGTDGAPPGAHVLAERRS